MNIYDLFMKPFEDNGLRSLRKRLLKSAEGIVLELGVGTGANLPYYQSKKIEKLILTDLTKRSVVLDKIGRNIHNPRLLKKTIYQQADVQKISMEDNSVDTIVATLIFCSVSEVESGLREIKRILKPGGQLIFIEHVISHRKPLATIMNFMTPLWKRLAHGCHLNRDYKRSLRSAGFNIIESHGLLGSIFIGGIAQPIND